jgi:hypothetical protein
MKGRSMKDKQAVQEDLRPEYRREDLGPGDRVQVAAAEPAFLLREGRIKVGSGDPVEDVRKARKLIGRRRPRSGCR